MRSIPAFRQAFFKAAILCRSRTTRNFQGYWFPDVAATVLKKKFCLGVSPGASSAWAHASARKTNTAVKTVLRAAIPLVFTSDPRSRISSDSYSPPAHLVSPSSTTVMTTFPRACPVSR